MKRAILSAVLLILSATCAGAEDVPKIPGLSGMNYFTEVTDMNNAKSPTTIPKRWKLVGVDGNNLWFQDTDGQIYLVQGIMRGGAFYTTGVLERLTVK